MVLDAAAPGATSPPGAAGALKTAVETEDWDAISRFSFTDWTSAWFYLNHGELATLLERIPPSALDRNAVAQLFHGVMNGVGTTAPPESLATLIGSTPIRLAASGAMLRMQGRLAEAYEHTLEAHDQGVPGELTLFDNTDGVVPMLYLQSAITAFLAGDLQRARAYLLRAVGEVEGPFAFAPRDAAAKTALLHAAFGNAHDAEAAIAHARELPPTTSWVERGIDAELEIAAALLTGATPLSDTQIAATSWRTFGEMWPLGLLAHLQHLLFAGELQRLDDTITMIELMHLPGSGDESLAGAILPLARADLALALGSPRAAERHIRRAPQRLLTTQLTAARAALQRGDHATARRRAAQAHSASNGLGRMRFEALTILAAAAVASGDRRAADALAELALHLGDVAPFVRSIIPSEVTEYAAEHRDDPRLAPLLEPAPEPLYPAARAEQLSPREQEVLRRLVEGLTAPEIAAASHVSVNTVKTHVRSIYRKLGVGSRDDAIAEARRLGY